MLLLLLPKQRENLVKLAEYLEALPKDYKHFDMRRFMYHSGECDMDDPEKTMVEDPHQFLSNCGTVACAVGHGPAAGVPFNDEEITKISDDYYDIDWCLYSGRAFGVRVYTPAFDYLFASRWRDFDNTSHGAAARIRYFLSNGAGEIGDMAYMHAA